MCRHLLRAEALRQLRKSKDNGSVVSTYSYDWNDRLASVQNDGVTIADYTYTDARQRLSMTVGTNTKYYINSNVEYDGDYTNHVFAGANRVLTSDVDGLHYTHKDHLQSTSLTTDSGGIVEEAVDYNPFGSERDRAGTHESDYTFTDQERDTETGLMYYDARYYDANLKRFTSIDPPLVGLDKQTQNERLSNPQDTNLYTYGLNNPLKYNDPNGEAAQSAGVPLGMAIVGGVTGMSTGLINLYLETPLDQEITLSDTAGAAFKGGLEGAIAGFNIGYGILFTSTVEIIEYLSGEDSAEQTAEDFGTKATETMFDQALRKIPGTGPVTDEISSYSNTIFINSIDDNQNSQQIEKDNNIIIVE